MKKLIFLLLTMIPFIAFSQKAKIQFETTSHNFGTIGENAGLATYEFSYKNTGDVPLILTNVRAGCGCTTPEWDRQPVAPNATGKVKVSYNPKNRPGPFVKSITVNTNGDPTVLSLTIRGDVTKKPVDPYAAYTYAIGDLKLTSNNLNLGNINNTQTVEKVIEYINTGNDPITLNVLPDNRCISVTVAPTSLQKGEKGKIQVRYNAAEKKDWGFVSNKLNIKTSQGNEGAVAIVANITEDFTAYQGNNSANAPVASFSEKETDLGALAKNEVKKHEFYIENTGKSDLIIRKIKTSDNSVTVTPAKTIIKPEKKVKVTVSLKTDDQPGKKTKIVSFTLNDPQNTIVSYKLSGNVQ